jgi:hypothetical protein
MKMRTVRESKRERRKGLIMKGSFGLMVVFISHTYKYLLGFCSFIGLLWLWERGREQG